MTLRVVTYFWHNPEAKHCKNYQYTPEHVRRLYRGVKRNLSVPFTFHVITDRPHEIYGDDIDVIPIDRWQHVINKHGRCYVKLGIFGWWAREYFGDNHILTLDLDLCVVGSLDSLVHKGMASDFTGWKSTHSTRGQTRTYCGALHMHRSGSVRQIWDAFGLVHKIKADGDELRGSDQRWITNILGEDRYPSWNTQDDVYDIFDVEKEHDLTGNILPSNACIVAVN